jgi:anhydro-N-acetylmuramic acid kinase
MIAIGIMSGTSLDGVDVAIINIDNENFNLIGFVTVPYQEELKNKILECSDLKKSNVQKICSLNVEVSYAYVEAIKIALEKFNINIDELSFIAMHGQTIWHNPNKMDGYYSSTLQIGDPSIVAYAFNKDVISNFRTMDMAAGGSGAPLMPYAHYLMFKNEHKKIAIQNIGGIGNITYIDQENITAFDTGPGNMLIDGAMKILYNMPYDNCGNIAKRGKVIKPVLDYLMQDEYLSMPYPKSTGREKYSSEYLNRIINTSREYTNNKEDIITTITAYTAETIIDQIRRFFKGIEKIVIAGGGANNEYIMNYLQDRLDFEVVKSNINDEMEAIGFALLGYATINNMPSNVKSVTGARDSVILGNITKAPLH